MKVQVNMGLVVYRYLKRHGLLVYNLIQLMYWACFISARMYGNLVVIRPFRFTVDLIIACHIINDIRMHVKRSQRIALPC